MANVEWKRIVRNSNQSRILGAIKIKETTEVVRQ